jgi:polar amino acid transport system permease protein
MGERTGICCIVLPQALRLSIPGWANEFSILLKDSAICYVLGTQDILARTSFAAARTHEHLALYAAAGALYCLLTLVVLRFLRRLQEKVQVPGYAAGSGLDGMEMG